MLCVIQAFLYVVCGTYGPVSELGFGLAFLIGLQVTTDADDAGSTQFSRECLGAVSFRSPNISAVWLR